MEQMRASKGWYWLILLVTAVLTLLYVERRNLYARYREHVDMEMSVKQTQEQCERLEREAETARQHIQNLGTDPIEIEAAIRRSKDLVREGEKIYRIQEAPENMPQKKPAAAPVPQRPERGT